MKLTFEDRQRLGPVLTGYVASLECRVAQDAANAAHLARKWKDDSATFMRNFQNSDGIAVTSKHRAEALSVCAAELEAAFNLPKP